MEHAQNDWEDIDQYFDDIPGNLLPPELIRAGRVRERTERPVANTAVAKDSSRVRSLHESNTFNVDDEVLRKKNGKIHC